MMLRQARACVIASKLLAPPVVTSSVYLTSPVDCPEGSEPFLNTVLEAELMGDPAALLRELRVVETGLGRTGSAGPTGSGGRNGPRCIDLDLLYAGNCEVRTDELVLPHPGIGTRRFVLAPLAEIQPGLRLPGLAGTILELLEKLPAGDSAEILDAKW